MRRNKFNKVKSKTAKHSDSAVVAATRIEAAPSSFVRSAVRKPNPAMLSLASVMLATTAMAQEALPTIDVQESTGTGTGGYQATAPQVSRIPTPLLNTPQTVNVVTQQVLQEQRLTSMEDALRTVPGITFAAGEGGNQGDTPIIRGFAARGDIFRDGIRDPGWYTRDLFSADRVEVYKGPSAFAFGRGSTGGAINLVTKLPTGSPIPYVEGFVSGTSVGGYRAELDAGGKKDNVSARISAMYQDMPTPDRDNVGVKRWGVAPSVKIDFDSQTRAVLSYVYQGEESVPDYGVPYLPAPVRNSAGALTSQGYYGNGQATTPIPVPRSTWYGVKYGPLADIVQTDTHIGTIKLERDLAPDLKISNATRYISNDRFAINTAPRSLGDATNTAFPASPAALPPDFYNYPVGQMTIGRQHFQIETENTLLTNQTDIGGKFYTGSLLHTFSAGFEATRETRFQQRARGVVSSFGNATNLCDPVQTACRTSAYYPVDSGFGGAFGGYNTPLSTETTTLAAYAFDQIKINDYFEVLGSIRQDHYEAKFADPGNAAPASRNLSRTDEMTSWRVGGIYHPTKNSSVYAAYGVSFNPSAEFGVLSSAQNSTANVLLAPEKNNTIEVGAKADFLNNKLSLSGAIFRIEKTNLRIPLNPEAASANQVLVLDGLARVDGIEVGIAGALTDKWQIFAGYSYLQSEILNTTNGAERGRALPNTPHNNFNLWTSYAITPDFTIGGGAQYQDDAFVNTTNTSYVPSFWKFDAMAAYKVTKNSTLQLNVYNIGDAMYYAQYYQGHAVPASGRYAALSYRIRFEPEPAVIPTKIVK